MHEWPGDRWSCVDARRGVVGLVVYFWQKGGHFTSDHIGTLTDVTTSPVENCPNDSKIPHEEYKFVTKKGA